MDYSFGNWIERRRKTLDLSQQELADRVGVPYGREEKYLCPT
jgi:transcriptional regulator with XRE-family HTH domain